MPTMLPDFQVIPLDDASARAAADETRIDQLSERFFAQVQALQAESGPVPAFSVLMAALRLLACGNDAVCIFAANAVDADHIRGEFATCADKGPAERRGEFYTEFLNLFKRASDAFMTDMASVTDLPG